MAGITTDVSKIIRQANGFDALASKLQDRVAARAMSTVARRVGPEVNRQLAKDLNLSTRKIKERVSVVNNGTSIDVTGSGKQIALSEFSGAKWGGPKTAGAVVQVFREQPAKTYISAFITSGRVVARKIKSGGKRVGRLPLRQLVGPDVGSILISTGPHQIAGPLLGFVRDTLSAEVQRLIGVELKAITG